MYLDLNKNAECCFGNFKSFSKNEFYNENAEGEGVVTGFATIADRPFYVVAQNYSVLRFFESE